MPKPSKPKTKPKITTKTKIKIKIQTSAEPVTQHFEAPLERLLSRLNWIIARMPFDAAKLWGTRGQIKVKGEINGFPFCTSLFPTREGRHFLLVNKKMQKGSRAVEGSVARFQMKLDTEERIVIIPNELKRFLAEDRSLRRWYDELNHSTRNDIAKWVSDPESAAARNRRAEQMAERLLNVMDAERELPPVLKTTFMRHPHAQDGWDAMSPARRRSHLFGIFYYRTPNAQVGRIEKMLDDASALAEKIRDRKK
jgi:uncharacterized protein YdeI (YjbR/CyaY-like superfamily)